LRSPAARIALAPAPIAKVRLSSEIMADEIGAA